LNIHFTATTALTDLSDLSLVIDISQRGSYALVLDDKKNCIALHGDAGAVTTSESIKRLCTAENLLQGKFTNIHVFFGNPECALVPNEFVPDTHRHEMLELIFGKQEEVLVRTDYREGEEIQYLHLVPRSIDATLKQLYPSAVSFHLYSLLPRMYPSEGNQLLCLFGSNVSTVMLTIHNKVQVIQTFGFHTPEDVTYHLLQLCKVYDVLPDECKLNMAGMVDANSPLYQSLYSFFSQVSFLGIPEGIIIPDVLRQYPEHYFSHLFAAAQCV